MKRLGFRYKLLLVLVTLPLASLSLFLWLAIDTFREDKLAYVYDSSLALSVQMANQIRTEISASTSLARQYLTNFDEAQAQFNTQARKAFEFEKRLAYLIIVEQNSVGAYSEVGRMGEIQNPERVLLGLKSLKEGELQIDRGVEADLRIHGTFAGSEGKSRELVMGLYLSELGSQFVATGDKIHLVADSFGNVALGPENFSVDSSLLKMLSRGVEGTGESQIHGVDFLVSLSPIGVDGLYVVSAVSKSLSMSAIQSMLRRSVLFFLTLIGITLSIAVVASGSLTGMISRLSAATRQVASGDFDIVIADRSNDELGDLAKSFEGMAHEVSRLLDETADKARMEAELLTAQTVQQTLFPEEHFVDERAEICGYYKSASECGGDWWSYARVDDYLYLWIGDATGHGVSAALLTSAAKTAASLAERKKLTPSQSLELLNQSIYEVAKGQLMMTFFAARINLSTRTLTYANASHNPPFVIQGNLQSKPKKKDLISLVENNGRRLGQEFESEYGESVIMLEPGARLIFFTDGIIEFTDPQGEMWQERNFIRSMIRANAEASTSASTAIEAMTADVETYRQGHPPDDDITLFQVNVL